MQLKEVKVKKQAVTLQLEKERISTARHVQSAERAKELARQAVKHAGKARECSLSCDFLSTFAC